MAKSWWKILLVVVGVLVIAFLGYLALDGGQLAIFYSPSPSPVPSPPAKAVVSAAPTASVNHDVQISELNTLYDQEIVRLGDIQKTADDLKSRWEKTAGFDLYFSIVNRSTAEIESTFDNINQTPIGNTKTWNELKIKEKERSDSKQVVRCAYYTAYIREQDLVLVQIKGLIDSLKANYSDASYKKANDLLKSIPELSDILDPWN